jgi:hypothetical protein
MDGAALGAEMGAGLAGQLLEFGGVHIQDNAACRAFSAFPACNEIHEPSPFLDE